MFFQVIIHPLYDRIYNDLALVKLSVPLNFNESNLMPICLPSGTSFNESVEKGVVAGKAHLCYSTTMGLVFE